jgi:hypothetical protein
MPPQPSLAHDILHSCGAWLEVRVYNPGFRFMRWVVADMSIQGSYSVYMRERGGIISTYDGIVGAIWGVL